MREPVDRNRRHGWKVAKQLYTPGVEQGDVIQPADVAGEAQLHSPSQFILAVALALLAASSTRTAATLLNVAARDLKIDERERRGRGDGNREAKRERQPERLRAEDVTGQHSA